MSTIDRRVMAATGLALGLVLGGGCPGDDGGAMATDGASTGPELCPGAQVTCPDGSCQQAAPGACCGHGGLCESEDETGVDPTNITTPTTTVPPTSTLPTDPSVTDTITDSSTTDSTITNGSSSSDEGGSTSTGMMGPDGCYDPLIHPYDGALCGPAGSPCVVQVSETVQGTPATRSGSPSVAVDDDCQPAALLADSAGGANGFFAQRIAADTWDVQPTPYPMVEGGLDFDPMTGFWHAAVYQGSFDVSARTYDGVWNAGDPLAGNHSISAKAFAASGDATLHGVTFEPAVGFRDTVWDGAWMPAPAPSGGPTDLSAALAVAPDGTHHFTYWHNGGLEPVLRWETSAGDLEDVIAYGNTAVSPALTQEVVVTTDGGPAVPHVLAATETGVGNRVQVQYIRRDGVDTWTSYVLASEDPTGETTCDVPPLGPGEACTLDRTTYRPLAIVSSQGGDVRWLYSETHELVDYFSECTPACDWTPLADMSTYDVHLGWLDAGMPQSVVLLPDTRFARANAEVDGLGQIHVVAYAEEIPDAIGTALTVQYARLGP